MMSDREKELLKYTGYGKGDNMGHYSDGCCVLAGHYLITARHCIRNKTKFYFHPEFRLPFLEIYRITIQI